MEQTRKGRRKAAERRQEWSSRKEAGVEQHDGGWSGATRRRQGWSSMTEAGIEQQGGDKGEVAGSRKS